jgi:DNA-directed RNA polymerase specialized sigma24 family protein
MSTTSRRAVQSEPAHDRVPGEAPEPTPDLEIVQAVLRRDRKATAELVANFSDAVYAYVHRRLLPRIDLVDDLVQEVFIAALENLATFAGSSSLRTWLLGNARHKIEDHYRVPEREFRAARRGFRTYRAVPRWRCRVCHARVLAEHVEEAPIFWKHCPCADFQRR